MRPTFIFHMMRPHNHTKLFIKHTYGFYKCAPPHIKKIREHQSFEEHRQSQGNCHATKSPCCHVVIPSWAKSSHHHSFVSKVITPSFLCDQSCMPPFLCDQSHHAIISLWVPLASSTRDISSIPWDDFCWWLFLWWVSPWICSYLLIVRKLMVYVDLLPSTHIFILPSFLLIRCYLFIVRKLMVYVCFCVSLAFYTT